MKEVMYDIIIIGAGPAGITAAVYAARKKLKTLVLTKDIGGQAALSWDVENYTGYQFITGPELVKKFEDHLKSFAVETREGVFINSIEKNDDAFIVRSADEVFMSRTVIIATGRKPKMLNVPGEKKYINKGVTYCATCDAPIFEGKPVVVVGGGNSALDATIQLMRIASKIYLVNIAEELTGDAVMIEKINSSEKVKVMNNTEVVEILGGDFVERVTVKARNEKRTIQAEGVFIEIGSGPALVNIKGANIALTEKKEIIVNDRCETNIAGLFAAGDVTTVPEKQIIIAAGQGCIALLSAFRYLARKRFK
ncbi:MAG: FAD-dependent oxidoreductase [Candidatus Woesearchaeota archaeon]